MRRAGLDVGLTGRSGRLEPRPETGKGIAANLKGLASQVPLVDDVV
ncbi:MAG: hypothetical protein GY883_15870 [Shimia sp.]|nr:hypothetical protein [Shimia sp.]